MKSLFNINLCLRYFLRTNHYFSIVLDYFQIISSPIDSEYLSRNKYCSLYNKLTYFSIFIQLSSSPKNRIFSTCTYLITSWT